jgi:hypothetical protein
VGFARGLGFACGLRFPVTRRVQLALKREDIRSATCSRATNIQFLSRRHNPPHTKKRCLGGIPPALGQPNLSIATRSGAPKPVQIPLTGSKKLFADFRLTFLAGWFHLEFSSKDLFLSIQPPEELHRPSAPRLYVKLDTGARRAFETHSKLRFTLWAFAWWF